MNENFIRTYDDVLSNKLVKHLIQLAEQSVTWIPRSQVTRKDKQVELDAYWPRECKEVNGNLLEKAFTPYIGDFPYLQDQGTEWCSGSILLQKTEPLEGYHTFHCENSNWAYRHRVLAWMIYLNDVEEGGETQFLNINKPGTYLPYKVKPKRGRLLMFPPTWQYYHAGLKPKSGKKYLLHSYCHYG